MSPAYLRTTLGIASRNKAKWRGLVFQLATTTRTITKTTAKTITMEDATITKDDWAVLQMIRENHVVKAEEFGDKLGLTRAGAIYHINKLTKIRRVGTPRKGHWEVV